MSLVADYGNPGEMVPVTDASFLISEGIKSPMGANLSALSSEAHMKLWKQPLEQLLLNG